MKKKIIAFFVTTSIIFTGVVSNTFAQNSGVNVMERSVKNMQAQVNDINLIVSPTGLMKRTMNGNSYTMNYNTQYGCNVTFLKLVNWNGYFTALVYDNILGEKRVIRSGLGTVWQNVEYDTFAESDINFTYGMTFNVNDIDVYGDQLYIACDEGIILVLPPCSKCYKLKKVSDINIDSIIFENGEIVLNKGNKNEFKIDISSVRQDNISVEEALNLRGMGAILIDVREKDEFSAVHYEDSVNIPLSEINSISQYDKDKVLIFFCKSGGRAEKALKEAQKLGFVKVYNLGSVDKLIN